MTTSPVVNMTTHEPDLVSAAIRDVVQAAR